MSPNETTKEAILSLIRDSKTYLYMGTYILTDSDITQELISAKSRGVDVRLLLERYVYGNPSIHKKLEPKLASYSIPIRYSNTERFTFMHAKFLLSESGYIFGTGNMSHSSFTKNREFFIAGNNPETHHLLYQIFHERRFVLEE